MATKKQIEANRNNARKSTGPKSEEGKARSSQNAIKHGLTSRRVVLADEDEGMYRDFRMGIFEDLRPLGDLESMLAHRIVAQMWRLARIPAIEAQLIDRLRSDPTGGGHGSLGAAWEMDGSPYGGNLGRLSRYEVTLERSLTRMLAEFRRAQAHRRQRDEEYLQDAEDTSGRYIPGGWDSLERGGIPPTASGGDRGDRGGRPGGGSGNGIGQEAGLRKEANVVEGTANREPPNY